MKYIKTTKGNTISYPLLAKLGIKYIKDLFEDESIIHMENVNKKNITALENFHLKSTIKCIPKQWKEIKFTLEIQEKLTTSKKKSLKQMKTKLEYKKLLETQKTKPNSEVFFKNTLYISDAEMKNYYSIPFTSTIYTKLRSFQFKINHNILYTKEKLHRIGIKETPLCNLCQQQTETLQHLFVDCEKYTKLMETGTRKPTRPIWS